MYQGKYNEAILSKCTNDRHKMKINITPNFATMVAGHSKTRDYFHRFKIMKQANVLATMEIKQ